MQRKVIIFAVAVVLTLAICVVTKVPRSIESIPREEKATLQIDAAPESGFRNHIPVPAALDQTPLTLGQQLARMGDGEAEENRLTETEIANHLAQNHTNALSLVTAFQASGDSEFLRQAAASFPGDPLVQAKVLMHNLYPEQRQQWLEALKKSAPENSLPNFLAARDQMDQGNASAALAEITWAGGKNFNDYYRESALGLEEAYLEAGRPLAEAKALGGSEILLPQLAPLKNLGVQLAELSEQYGKAGDGASQQALLNGVYEMGTQLRASGNQGTLIASLVGLALQNVALQRWPEGIPAELIQGSVADQLAANRQYRENVKTDAQLLTHWLPSASENEILAYLDHRQALGEENALKWLKGRHPELISSQ